MILRTARSMIRETTLVVMSRLAATVPAARIGMGMGKKLTFCTAHAMSGVGQSRHFCDAPAMSSVHPMPTISWPLATVRSGCRNVRFWSLTEDKQI